MYKIRLQKYIALCGIASRRSAENLILQNEITINDKLAKLGDKVQDNDIIKYKGKIIKKIDEKIYIIINKPKGYITSKKDQFGRKTVMDFVPSNVYPVGRLDYNTSGLLILTNDGDLAYSLTHPKNEVPKKYIVEIYGNIEKNKIEQLSKGVYIDGYLTKKANVNLIKQDKDTSTLEITITEGKNRQIRKMIEQVGHSVRNLKRISISSIELGNLKIGEKRNLTIQEIENLKKSVKY
ncbi:MAG: rRNA pseudouridine synthase [Defluviitaleaceae bacterium]|nr:rRNA pseudouridine synthase [Defluviitaleaceae bacterium]